MLYQTQVTLTNLKIIQQTKITSILHNDDELELI